MKSVVEQGFSTNSHSTTRSLKHLSNSESDENVPSSNTAEYEFELCHIPKFCYQQLHKSAMETLVISYYLMLHEHSKSNILSTQHADFICNLLHLFR